jgi:hypothetical protein
MLAWPGPHTKGELVESLGFEEMPLRTFQLKVPYCEFWFWPYVEPAVLSVDCTYESGIADPTLQVTAGDLAQIDRVEFGADAKNDNAEPEVLQIGQ